MNPADLAAEHGSPLWVVNVDVLRDRWRSIRAAWESAWPGTQVAYSHKANRHPAVIETLGAAAAGHQVSSELEYELACTPGGADGSRIVVHGAAIPVALLERAAADGALVVADSASQLERATAAGVRRLGLRIAAVGAGQGPAFYGVAVTDVPTLVRSRPGGAPPIEALAMHLVPSGFRRDVHHGGGAVDNLVVQWPLAPERFAGVARTLAGMAVRLGVPAIDVGGGYPPAPDESLYARGIASALGAVGFDGQLIAEPGRAVVGEAVELVCTVEAIKRLEDGTRCIVVDAGLEVCPGSLFRWPRIEAFRAAEGPLTPALVIGPHARSHDVLHPAAPLPELEEGDRLVIRRVGAYNQSETTVHGALEAAVVVGAGDRWSRYDDGAGAVTSPPPA